MCVWCQCHRRLLLMGQSTQPVTLHLSPTHTRIGILPEASGWTHGKWIFVQHLAILADSRQVVYVCVFLGVHPNFDELAVYAWCTCVWVFHLPASFKAQKCHSLLFNTLLSQVDVQSVQTSLTPQPRLYHFRTIRFADLWMAEGSYRKPDWKQ